MTDANDTPNTSGEGEDDRVQLLPFEQNLMLDTFINDVLFVNARGLALERLFFNHLHLYSDPKATYFVLNTRPEDEHYFLEKLRTINPECPPKIITAEVLSADRQIIYQSGGIQFVTSRILMVDLLKDRVPFDKVYGILIYRAHEVQFGFQESFIMRLFREKKPHNFTIKAFTDCPEYIVADGALGQLQRLITLLYVRRVVILPRFHNEVKACFDANQPTITQMSIKLEPAQRKAQASLRDIIATCLRELKQSTKGLDTDSDTESMASSAATLRPTKLERDLSRCDVPLTDRQQRLVTDLRMLRQLFQKVEQLDPTNALNFVHWLRKDPDILHNNSGWLFTQSAATLFSNIDALCSLRDLNGDRTISTPAKWSIFCSILQEITAKLVSEDLDYPVLVLVSSDQLSRQLIDLIKFGQRRYTWMLTRKITDPNRRDSLALAPPIEPVWNPVNVACYDAQIYEKDRQNLLNTVKMAQKEEAKKRRQKGKLDIANRDPKQPRLDQFGIQPYARPMSVPTSDKNNGPRKKRKSGREVAVAKRKSPIRIPLSREKMPGEEVYLPEDPFTSFYVHEEETKRAVNGEELPENNKSKSNDDPSIVALDDCEEEHRLPASPSPPPRILNSEEEDEERSLSLETNEHRVNKSIAGAARERAEKSIHVIDEFQFESSNISSDTDVDGVGIEPNQPCTFNNSLNSMLVFLELGNRYRLINCLESLKPRHVILYSQDIACTRIIETFKAVHSDHPLELYMLMYEESSEEERYLSSIQRELEAIETLIKEQGLVMMPREFDVSRDSVSQLRRITMPNGGRRVDSRTKRTVATSSSRSQALMDADKEFEAEMRPLVIVDMREFNSELPIVLYKRGIDLEAVTLEVGDYILSPEICCERKSLDDLAQSLVNGRLFKQVEQMTKHYKNCILLIESTEKYRNRVVRIGAFQGELSRRAREARQLFVMLLQSYPQLHVLWSVSPAHSAELFEELKLDQPNPMLEAALKKRRERFVDEEI